MTVLRIATLMLAMTPILADAAAAKPSVEERLRALEERQQQLEQMIRERDARIETSSTRTPSAGRGRST